MLACAWALTTRVPPSTRTSTSIVSFASLPAVRVCGGWCRGELRRPPSRSPCSSPSLSAPAPAGVRSHSRMRVFSLAFSVISSPTRSFLGPTTVLVHSSPMPLGLVACAPCCPPARFPVLSRPCGGWVGEGVRDGGRHRGRGRSRAKAAERNTNGIEDGGMGAGVSADRSSGGSSSRSKHRGRAKIIGQRGSQVLFTRTHAQALAGRGRAAVLLARTHAQALAGFGRVAVVRRHSSVGWLRVAVRLGSFLPQLLAGLSTLSGAGALRCLLVWGGGPAATPTRGHSQRRALA